MEYQCQPINRSNRDYRSRWIRRITTIQYGQSGRGPIFRNYVGGEIGEMWGLETTGEVEMIYLEDGTRHPNNDTGESYVVDQNGDGVIDRTRTVEDGGDLVKIGQNTPDFYWGLNSSMQYKSLILPCNSRLTRW